MTSADARHAGAPRDDAPLHTLIMQHTVNGRLRMRAVQGIAQECGCHIRHVECAALLSGILPERYARNTKQFSLEDQRALLLSRVLLVGLGGLGGHVLDMLVRLGVGHITAADGDVFRAQQPEQTTAQFHVTGGHVQGAGGQRPRPQYQPRNRTHGCRSLRGRSFAAAAVAAMPSGHRRAGRTAVTSYAPESRTERRSAAGNGRRGRFDRVCGHSIAGPDRPRRTAGVGRHR